VMSEEESNADDDRRDLQGRQSKPDRVASGRAGGSRPVTFLPSAKVETTPTPSTPSQIYFGMFNGDRQTDEDDFRIA